MVAQVTLNFQDAHWRSLRNACPTHEVVVVNWRLSGCNFDFKRSIGYEKVITKQSCVNFEGAFGVVQPQFGPVSTKFHNPKGNMDSPWYTGDQAAVKSVGFSRRICMEVGEGESVIQGSHSDSVNNSEFGVSLLEQFNENLKKIRHLGKTCVQKTCKSVQECLRSRYSGFQWIG